MLTDLSAQFIIYFIKNKHLPITLENAAQEFCFKGASKGKIKTKIRRLYDISNIFLALGIVEKTIIQTRKPAFLWKGIAGYKKFKY